jgi:uncharacterized protein
MPYGISNNQADCQGWATVKQEADGSYSTLYCHGSKQDAIDQMVAASLDENMEPLGEVRQSMLDEIWKDSLRTGKVENDMSETVQWVTTELDERRSVAYSNLEVRSENDGRTLIGYAAVWDSPSEFMGFTEFVKRGAFSKTLNDGADVRLLIDHDGVPLARTKSGTMSLFEDERGLRVEAELDPLNPDAARVMSAMKRGDLSQMSFAFRTVKDSWNGDRTVRELREVQLFDVSVVTFPAYEQTVAELRSKYEQAEPQLQVEDKTATVPATSGLLLRKNQIALQKYRSR